MKILPLNDIHFEFQGDKHSFITEIAATAEYYEVDAIILAGDIFSPGLIEGLFPSLLKEFPGDVLYVMGNHDCWYSTIQSTRESVLRVADKFNNLKFIDNNITEINGKRFLGGTLWYKNDPINIFYEEVWPDFLHVKNPQTIYEENEKLVDHLNNNVKEGDIVITHHLPHPLSIHPKYINSDTNRFFLCNMDNLINSAKPKFWFHGHTHESCDYEIYNTRVICNPYGYQDVPDLNDNFQMNKIIEI